MRHWLILALLLSAGAAPASERSYITDSILAEVYARPSSVAVPIASLPTGTPVDILENRGGFSRITLPDESTGWVRRELLTPREPAQSLLLRLSDDYARSRQQVERLEKRLQQEEAAWDEGWILFIAMLGALFGFFVGVLWLDYRNRERHGGFRL